jgi:hypothetical protein
MAEIGARYEAEHALLYEVDQPRFAATLYHAEGSGHPILGELATATSLMSTSQNVDFSCGQVELKNEV